MDIGLSLPKNSTEARRDLISGMKNSLTVIKLRNDLIAASKTGAVKKHCDAIQMAVADLEQSVMAMQVSLS